MERYFESCQFEMTQIQNDDYPRLEREDDTYDIINDSQNMQELKEMYLMALSQ